MSSDTSAMAFTAPLGDGAPAPVGAFGQKSPGAAPQSAAVGGRSAFAPAASLSAHQPPEELSLETLPSFSRNLLRIRIPVTVTLASKRQAVGKIVELLPGSIIQFSKSCEEMLEMEVNGHPIALGECVKVGDKFGLRVTSIQMPGERFESVGRPRVRR